MPEPPTPWLPKLIAFILSLVIVAVFLQNQNELPRWNGPGFNPLLFIPALYAAIGVHEFGHVVAATLAGVDIGGIAVGGFALIKSGKNWLVRFDRQTCLSGGFVHPLTNSGSVRTSRWAWMIAGGPLASLVLTAACALKWLHSAGGTWDWTGSLLWTSLFITIQTLVPFDSGLNRSDGALLLLLLRRPHEARAWRARMAVQTEKANGVRPREWNPQLFAEMLAVDATACEYPYCHLMAFYRRLDEGSTCAALQHLENALAGSAASGRPFRHILFLEAAFASAVIRMQAAQARCWCERVCQLRKPESLHAIEAGIATCEGRYQDAGRHWAAAIAHVVRRRLDSGLTRFAKRSGQKTKPLARHGA